jgi:hypothetical protein
MKDAYSKLIDICGKIMLVWFVFSTIRYFYYGRFFEEIRMIPRLFDEGFEWLAVYTTIQVPFAAIGIFIVIPLLLKGHILGLILGILHWIMGYPTNPLWFIVPKEMQISPSGGPSFMLIGINIFYAIITFAVLILFYFHRRAVFKREKAHNQSIHATGQTGA